ncbi:MULTISPECIES: UDP-N-acetylmuramoyl-tripeptide--D-alanyl-D-alanine ligase [Corynebacterium]|uniref:UDP-N-acetylmuramoyl-tripeptide--D-alanyl-D- alanine ligase n=1 Tax=Corynebacterium TaxID=1716 RepID=UPI001958D80C|nr:MULTISPECIES: UDP-N-acetylmuramoyl-tripeptide--D-alanyl-D-alanine ligase [Corynebacterium]MDN8625065.1 UDP-N-acetylmuramoyl-tripeptide--D-alanyl-D-alanine ligase [Corynebacterium kroppenstedtii]QRQ64820.1 UDP-N-acetylmuramoyl-tripeptide--D-alanyl-D-alanine ligase [Corynebacterium kroppenstedtii]
MIPMTAGRLADITGGYLVNIEPDAVVPGPVEFDSRKIAPGSVFLALPGARVNGHDFAAQAIKDGATLALLSRDMGVPAVIIPHVEHVETNATALEYDRDGEGEAALAALSKLAHHTVTELVAHHDLRVIGVTGSAGKTSTKDMIATILRSQGETVAPPGSFNNEIGHPYTALRCTESTRFLVAEMSARGIGHIAHLAHIAPPTIGAVLNVGTAHLGEFGSREAIAQAKGELVEALPSAEEDGVAILNADDRLVSGMAARTSARVITFSVSPSEDTDNPIDRDSVIATDVVLDSSARASFTLTMPTGESAPVQLQVYGQHQVANALAAAAVGCAVGIPVDKIATALSHHTAASANRMDVRNRRDGVTIINDSYNANPDSMRAGIAALASTVRARENVQSWAVLGQMGELGASATDEHYSIGEELGRYQINHVVVVGNGVNQRALAHGAKESGVDVTHVDDVDAAVDNVWSSVRPGDVVLIKASYSDGLWRVAEGLLSGQDEGNGE